MAPGNALKVMEDLLALAASKKASDLHLLVGKPPILRIEGDLLEQKEYPALSPENAQALIGSILNKKQQEEFIREKEIDFSYEIKGVSRFRVNVLWEKDNVGLVARVISNDIPTMESIDMPKVVYELTRLKQGLILITGPTGCGKSTSMAAMVDLINKERKTHIITLEDPIEFMFASKKSYVRQRQLDSDFLSFAQALKHVVRQDPNVIMVGEMRDLETIAAAITVAETGHLVLATLHTQSAAQTIDRIIDVFPPYQQEQIRLQLSMELRGVISQQLVPGINGARLAAREIMVNTSAVSNMIRENKIAQLRTVLQTGAESGMISLEQDLKRLCGQGLITASTLKAYTVKPGD